MTVKWALLQSAAPTDVRATPGSGQVTLSWTPPTGGATQYNVYWSTSPGVTTATATKITGVAVPYPHRLDRWDTLLLCGHGN